MNRKPFVPADASPFIEKSPFALSWSTPTSNLGDFFSRCDNVFSAF